MTKDSQDFHVFLNPEVFSDMKTQNTTLTNNPVRRTSAKSSLRRRARITVPFLAAALLVFSASALRADVFSLVNDWSNAQNPHGPWSYNYNNAPISTFQ